MNDFNTEQGAKEVLIRLVKGTYDLFIFFWEAITMSSGILMTIMFL